MPFDVRTLNPENPKPLDYLKIRVCLLERNLSVRKLAHRLRRNAHLVGRVLRGQTQSRPIWSEVHRFFLDPEGYRPTTRRRTVRGTTGRAGKNAPPHASR
jgi:hypothetical protein